MKQGYENVAKVITPETTALLCATDTLALGASKYLQEQRIDTLQLASVGNTPLMKFLHPEIVTVDPGYAEAGRRGLPVDRAGNRAQRTATNHHPRHPVLIVFRTINCDLRCVSGTFLFLNFPRNIFCSQPKCHLPWGFMMSKINQTDIDRLIELVGGRGNIATVSHCITRLRFVLNQPANARPKEIEQLPMVKGCFTNAGQFQVVIGTNVGDYYQALIASTGQAQVDKEQVKKPHGRI